jgi:hypothetical protein
MKNKKNLRPCEKLAVLYSDYVDGELDKASCQQVEDHLRVCATCKLDIALMREITRNLAQIEEEVPSTDFVARVARAARRDQATETQVSLLERIASIFRVPGRVALVGAVAVLAVLCLTIPQSGFLTPPEGPQVADARLRAPRIEVLVGAVSVDGKAVSRPMQVALGQTVEAGRRGVAVLEYADDTRVAFRSPTRLACYDEGVRLEAGKVHVSVQKRPRTSGKPAFRVCTPNARVSVWGTKFTVAVKDGRTEVKVTKGLVGVERMADGKPVGDEARVPAGQSATVADGGDVIVKSLGGEPVETSGPSSTSEDNPLLLGDGN